MSGTGAFVFGMLADFCGGHRAPELAARRFVEVDRDTLDAAIRRLEPQIELGLPFCRTLRFSCWDDFHPDAIAERVPALRKLLDARSEVAHPDAMRRLLEEAGISLDVARDESGAPPTPQADAAPAEQADPGDLLDSILEGTAEQPRPPTRTRFADPQLEELIGEIAESSTDSSDYDLQERWRAAIDRELASRVCAVLHHPAFRSIEASWSSLRGLVRQADTGEQLRIRVLDLRRDEILEDVGESPELSTSQLHRLIYEEATGTPGGEPLDMLLTDLELGDSEDDLRVLAVLGALAGKARAPLLAAASASLCEAETIPSQGWRELRRSAPGRWLGLCYPRVLLRLPYGPDTESVERFELDESRDAGAEHPYLWGSSALTLGIPMACALAAEGTLDALPRFARLEGLPFHVFHDADEVQYRGPTEVLLTESRIQQLVELGIIPLAAIAGQDAAQLVAFRSISGDSFLGR